MSRRRPHHHHNHHHHHHHSTAGTPWAASSSPPSASPSPSRPSQSPAPASSRRYAQSKAVTSYCQAAKTAGEAGASLLAPSSSSSCVRNRARRWKWLTWRVAVAAPVALSILLFVDTLRCGFVYDDHRAVLGNMDVVGVVATSSSASFTSSSSSSSPASSSSWTDIWGNDFWGTPVTSSGSHGSWRPLTTLSFRINAVLASVLAVQPLEPEVPPPPPPPLLHPVPSALSPTPSPPPSASSPSPSSSSPPPLPAWTFHAVNVAIHAGVTGAYVGVLRAHGVGRLAALTAGLLFAAHPAHVEAVAGVVGRAELLAALGFCLALAAHAQYVKGTARASSAPSSSSSECSSCLYPAQKSHDADAAVTGTLEDKERKGTGGDSSHPSSRWAWLALSVALTGVAMLCKEQGAAALPVATLLHALRLFHRRRRRKGHAKETYLTWGASLLPATVSFVLLLYLRLSWVPLTPSFTAADNPIAHAPDSATRGLSVMRTWAYHAKLLLLPSTLSFDWSVDAVPLVTSFSDPANLGAFLLLGTLAALAFKAVVGSTGRMEEQDDDDGDVDEDNDVLQRQHQHQQRLASCRCTVDDDDDDLHDRLNNNVCRRARRQPSNSNNDDGDAFWGALFSPAFPTSSRSSRTSEHVALALALGVVPFLPASNLLVYVGFVVAERVLYIPSMGFCLLVALGIERLYELAAKQHQQEEQTPEEWEAARGATAAAWIGASPGGAGTKPYATPLPRGPSRRLTPTPSFLGAALRQEWRQVLVLSGTLLLLALFGARTLRRNLDWQSDESLYSVSASVSPAKALANLGVVYAESGRVRQAEEAYRAALTHAPNMADTHYNLGLLLANQGRTHEAVHSYQLALGARPWLAQAHLALAAALHNLGQRQDAIKVLETCSSLGEAPVRDAHTQLRNMATCQQRLARAHLLGGRPSDALAVLQSALLRATPGGAHHPLHSFYTLLAEAHLALGAPDEAEAWLQEALRARPNHVAAHVTYAKVLQANGSRAGDAESWLRRALVLDPRDVHAHKHLGQLLLDQGRLEDAVTEWLTATTLDPEDHTAAFNAATALRLAGRNRHAEVLYRRAAQLQPQDLASLRNLGAILHVNGKLEEALTQYERALRVAPQDPQTTTNLARLMRLMQEKAA